MNTAKILKELSDEMNFRRARAEESRREFDDSDHSHHYWDGNADAFVVATNVLDNALEKERERVFNKTVDLLIEGNPSLDRSKAEAFVTFAQAMGGE